MGADAFAISPTQELALSISYLVWLLSLPVCAMVAGVVVGVTNRGQEPEDGSLVRQFLLFLVIFSVVSWGASRLPSVQMYLDPRIKLRAQLEATPVYAAIQKYAPSDALVIESALGMAMARGARDLPEAFVRIRPVLAGQVQRQLGFADHATAVAWSRVMQDVLVQMRAIDPQKCLHTLYPEKGMPNPLSEPVLDAASAAAFMQAVADVHASADAGRRRDTPNSGPRVDLQALQNEHQAVTQQMKGFFGEDEGRTRDPQWRAQHPAQFCDIVVLRIQLMLQRDPPMAGALLRNYMRSGIN